MKLFVLSRLTKLDYDEVYGFVIRAEDESAARRIAAKKCGDEGSSTWIENWKSRCVELTPDGDAGVILTDFNAG